MNRNAKYKYLLSLALSVPHNTCTLLWRPTTYMCVKYSAAGCCSEQKTPATNICVVSPHCMFSTIHIAAHVLYTKYPAV